MTAKASAWREKGRAAAVAEAQPLLLPSGVSIMARRPGPDQLALWGILPLGLVSAVSPAGAAADAEESLRLMQGYRDLVNYCCVRPRISLDPVGEDEIHPRDVPDDDLRFILDWAMRKEESDALRPFRGERTDAGAGGNGGGIRAAAERTAGADGAGHGAGPGPGGDSGAGEGAPGDQGVNVIAIA